MNRGLGIFAHGLNVAGIVAVIVYAAITSERASLSTGAGSEIRDLIWFSVICGLASFATIEILKRVFRLRAQYQMRYVRRWLARPVESESPERREQLAGDPEIERILDDREKSSDDEPPAYTNMLSAMGIREGELGNVFDLPAEQLSGLIGTAADLAVTESRYPYFVRALTREPVEEIALGYARRMQHHPDEIEDERRRLARRVAAGIDQLQISLAEQWRRWVQGAALWIAGGYGIALAQMSTGRAKDAETLYVLAALVLGGIFAWVARDLAALVERARR